LILRLDELAAQVRADMFPPQVTINSFFYLGDLHYDDAYRSRILSAVEERAAHWKKGLVHKRGGPGSARAILDQYCEREKLTVKEFAKKAHVDESVIYALKRGKRNKCSPDVVARIANLVGCDPGDLLPDE